jgi:hypothetical protein
MLSRRRSLSANPRLSLTRYDELHLDRTEDDSRRRRVSLVVSLDFKASRRWALRGINPEGRRQRYLDSVGLDETVGGSGSGKRTHPRLRKLFDGILEFVSEHQDEIG